VAQAAKGRHNFLVRWGIQEGAVTSRIPIGKRLVQAGRIDADQLSRALAHQQKWGGRLGDALVALKLVSEPEVLIEVAHQHGLRYVQIGGRSVPAEIVRLVPEKYIRSRRVLPIALAPHQRRGQLFVATSAPQDLPVLDEVAFITGMAIQPVLVGDRDLDAAIKRHFGPREAGATLPAGAASHPSTAPAVRVA
jgi:type IV pilus assembly protein PilB